MLACIMFFLLIYHYAAYAQVRISVTAPQNTKQRVAKQVSKETCFATRSDGCERWV